MITNTDIQQGAITESKLSKNLRLKLANLEAGATAGQVPVVQSNGDLEFKELSGDLTLNADGSTTVTSTATTTTTETVSADHDHDGLLSASDKAKLDGIEVGAKGDQNAAEIKGLYESNSDTNAFTDNEQNKLASLPANAEENVNADWDATTGDAKIFNKPTLGTAAAAATTDFAAANHKSTHATGGSDAIAPSDIGAATNDHTHDAATTSANGFMASGDKTKLNGIEDNATADQSASEIKTAYESNSDTNVFTDADHTKLDNIPTLGSAAQAATSDFAAAGHNHDHDALTNFVANEHIDWTADQGTTNIHSGNYTDTEYTAGSGLSLSGTEFSYDNTVIASQVNLSDGLALYTPLSTYQGHGHGQYAVKADNLSDLTNATTARTNLGLGTAAQSATGDFAAAGHTHSTATASADGFMSSTDKDKLDDIDDFANLYVLPLGTPTVRGGYKLGYVENGKNYPVEVSSEQMYVNVPWTDTQLSTEQVQDIVGGMFSGNTETNITATYQDADGTIDLAVENYPSKYTAQITLGGGAQGTPVDFTLTTGSGTVTHNGYILNHDLGTQSFVASVRTPYDPADGNSDDQTPDTWNDLFNHLYWQHMDVGFDGSSITNNSVMISTVKKNTSSLPELSDNHCAIAIPVDADDDPNRIYLVTLIG